MTTPPTPLGLAYAAQRNGDQLDRLAAILDRIARDLAAIRAILEDRRP